MVNFKKIMMASAGGSNNYWWVYWESDFNDSDFGKLENTMPRFTVDLGYRIALNSATRNLSPNQYIVTFVIIEPDLGDLDAEKYFVPNNENQGQGAFADDTYLYFLGQGTYQNYAYKQILCKWNISTNAYQSAYESNSSNQSYGSTQGHFHYDTGKIVNGFGWNNGRWGIQVQDVSDTTSIDQHYTRYLANNQRRNGNMLIITSKNKASNYYIYMKSEYGNEKCNLIKMSFTSTTPVWERQGDVYSPNYKFNGVTQNLSFLSDGTVYLIEQSGSSYFTENRMYWCEIEDSTGAYTSGTNAKTQITRSGYWDSNEFGVNAPGRNLWVNTDASDNTYVTTAISSNSGDTGTKDYLAVLQFNSSMVLQKAVRISGYHASSSNYNRLKNELVGSPDLSDTYDALYIPVAWQSYNSSASPTEVSRQSLIKLPLSDITSVAGTYNSLMTITDITSSFGTASVNEGSNSSATGSADGSNTGRTNRTVANTSSRTFVETKVDF